MKDYKKETEVELGLGLSLGNGGGAVEKGRWGDYARIFTAKDFPNGFSYKRERLDEVSPASASASAALSGQVVGWPPIRSYRMNTLCNQAKTSHVEDNKGSVGGNENDESSNKKINHGSEKMERVGFVKVKMDGLPIGRKLDLNAHKSYESLAEALEEMFFNPSKSTCGGKGQPPKLLDGSSEFVLTYEDKEGDWMLVGDVPWGMFLNTVKRLRIMRTSEANGLGPKSQERNDKRRN